MSELEKLKHRVQNLSSEDFAKFRVWVLELDDQLWDLQIAEDFEAGKLNRLIAEGWKTLRRAEPERFDGPRFPPRSPSP